VPVGSTKLLGGDKLLILAEDKKTLQKVYDTLQITNANDAQQQQ
jgi:hypothetical protein